MSDTRSEHEKMLAGDIYRSPDDEIIARAMDARARLDAYNATPQTDMDRRTAILREALVGFGPGLIRSPVTWEFGNILIGNGCFFNYDCIFLDSARITIGDHVAVGPRVVFSTAGHPLEYDERAAWNDVGRIAIGAMGYARPIVVGEHVWIGASVTILPGVTIGARSTIGAGSIVNRSIPPDVVAAGNPCRVIRTLRSAERADAPSSPAIPEQP